jgi:hypothetical protein
VKRHGIVHKLMLTRHDVDPRKPQEYTFYSKPLGVYEQWHTQQRFVANSGEHPETDFSIPETEDFTHFGPLQAVPKDEIVEELLFRDLSRRMA